MSDVPTLYDEIEQKKRIIETWHHTFNRAKEEIEQLNLEILALSSQLANAILHDSQDSNM